MWGTKVGGVERAYRGQFVSGGGQSRFEPWRYRRSEYLLL